MNIFSWISNNAKNIPHKTCIQYQNDDISYFRFHRFASSFGCGLKKEGIKKGDNVIIALSNIPEYPISLMGILAIGAVAVPCNPNYSVRELKSIINDSIPKAIIYDKNNNNVLTAIKQTSFPLISIKSGVDGNFSNYLTWPYHDIEEDVSNEDIAIIMYSSFTKGCPIGAVLTHANLMHNAYVFPYCFGVDHTDKTLSLIPLFHAFGLSQNLFTMFCMGGTTYLIESMDRNQLPSILKQMNITVIAAVPTVYYTFARHPVFNGVNFSKMKLLLSGGDHLPLTTYDLFKKRFDCSIRQGYGLTEASPACTMNNIEDGMKPMSVGRAVHDVDIKIVNENGASLNYNEVGEILIKGPNVMKGYYKKEHETKERIRGGWLYTGDLGYVDDNKNVFITGLKKNMFINAGYNVYPGEIELVLSSHPGVRACTATCMPDPVTGNKVEVFIVKERESITEDDIAQYAKENLVSYKQPKRISFVNSITY